MVEYPLEYLPVDKLIPNDWNPNKMNEKGFSRLVNEVSEHSVIETCAVVPVTINGEKMYRIIGGEHRWRAAKEAGDPKVPALILVGDAWQNEDLQKFVTMRLNVLRGSLNPDKFLSLYDDMTNKYGPDAVGKLMGYTDEYVFRKIVDDVKKSLKNSLPKDMGKNVDKALSNAKTVDDLSRIVQMLFHQYGDSLDMSFMIFTFGKREHIYVQMNAKTKKMMDKIMMYCRAESKNINDIIEPMLETFNEDIKNKQKENDDKSSNKSDLVEQEDDVPF